MFTNVQDQLRSELDDIRQAGTFKRGACHRLGAERGDPGAAG